MEKNIPQDLQQKALMLLDKELSDPKNCEGEVLVAEYRKTKDKKTEERIKHWVMSTLTSMLLPEPEAVVKVLKKNKFITKDQEEQVLKWLTSFRSHNSYAQLKKGNIEAKWEL